MRAASCLLALVCLGALAAPARAEEAKKKEATPPPAVDDAATAKELADGKFEEQLVLDDGRLPIPKPHPNKTSFTFRGEYQLRFRAMSDLHLEPPIGSPPGENDVLGQNAYLYHWARLRPVFQYKDIFKIHGEIDVPRGLVAGDTTDHVWAARDDYGDRRGYDVYPRQLYLQYTTPIGLFRLGQQTSHWGMGLLANDGDHASLFGDYRRGSLVERLLFATRPLGKDGPLALVLGGDIVFEDSRAELLEGDRAYQGIAAVLFQLERFEVGIYGVVRHQERDDESVDALTPFTEDLTVGVVDVYSRWNAPIPGASAFLFGELEAAFIGGTTTAGDEEAVRSFGAAARLGITTVAKDDDGRRYGEVVVAAEYGYASGDADPYDGVTKRFTFDQNHNVGLVLFDHVLAWKTARAATIAQDPGIVNRAAPGLQFLPSEGGVFGAQYLNPTIVVRPRHWLDLKAGLVIAQSTADVVDPFHAGALGDFANYDGGDETNLDLGLEIDLGFDFRIPVIPEHFLVNVGAEGGILFPGRAFDDANGAPLDDQYLLNTKAGIEF
jgi:hypothetical protein